MALLRDETSSIILLFYVQGMTYVICYCQIFSMHCNVVVGHIEVFILTLEQRISATEPVSVLFNKISVLSIAQYWVFICYESFKPTNNWNVLTSLKNYFTEETQSSYLNFNRCRYFRFFMKTIIYVKYICNTLNTAVLQLYLCISFAATYLPMITKTFHNTHDSTSMMPVKYVKEVYWKDKDYQQMY